MKEEGEIKKNLSALSNALTCLTSRLARSVDGHFYGFGVGGDLRRRRAHNYGQREALACNKHRRLLNNTPLAKDYDADNKHTHRADVQ